MAKRLWELFYTFAKVGVMTFGGGYAMLPILQREVVENKGWATEEELANWFAIGQCTPGVIAVNTATFAGRKVLGNIGGVVATLGVVFPSLIIISLLAGVITTFAEVAAARRRIHDYLAEKPGDVDFNDAAALQVDLGILRREELQEKMDILDTESHILRLGTVAFATNPFELFLDFGNQIKARSYAEQTFLVQLAGGSEGYLPTEKAEKGGHYSAFLASGLVGHAGGEQLVRETLKNINKLFAE